MLCLFFLQIKPEPHTVSNQFNATDTNSDNDSGSDDDSLKRRRDLLTRRPSYHRILKDITGPDIAGNYKCNHYRFSWFLFYFIYFIKKIIAVKRSSARLLIRFLFK